MIRIKLVCAAGMSTSMLMQKMNDYAKTKEIDVDIKACSESELAKESDNVDILLLGPQIRYLLTNMKKLYSSKIPVIEVINMSDYGLMNSEKVLNYALNAFNKAVKGVTE